MSLWFPARELWITWGQDPSYWKWTTCQSHSNSTSFEVAGLLNVCWLEIKKTIDVRNLPVKTSHSAFLVFKLQEDRSRLEKATASVRFVNDISDESGDEGYTVFIDRNRSSDDEKGRFPHLRSDGWLEIKLGEFYNNSGDDGEVEIRLFETDNYKWKSGLIVRGIDIRPNEIISSSSSIFFGHGFLCPCIGCLCGEGKLIKH